MNKLGHIIHSSTHEFYGMANKNVGDAFLLSWKLCDGVLLGFSDFTDTATEEERCVRTSRPSASPFTPTREQNGK